MCVYISVYVYTCDVTKGQGGDCNIVCTQPRRLAAVGVAERIAAERCVFYKCLLTSFPTAPPPAPAPCSPSSLPHKCAASRRAVATISLVCLSNEATYYFLPLPLPLSPRSLSLAQDMCTYVCIFCVWFSFLYLWFYLKVIITIMIIIVLIAFFSTRD